MPKFESPLGKKTVAGQPLKEIDVPDESGYSEPVESEKFTPSVTRRYGQPLDENALREFQARLEAQADPESEVSAMEREVRQAREAKRTGKVRLSDGARRRIEMLIGLTRGTRTAEIEGQVYVLQTLKSKEMRESILSAAEFDGTVQFPFEFRKHLLARSLVQVAGVDINQFVGSVSLEDRLSFLDEIDEALLDRLYAEYMELVKEAKDRYSIKNEQEAKEVVEDLKK